MSGSAVRCLATAAKAAAGLCCALLLLELGLRGLGLFFGPGKITAGADGRIVVLCEGDSFVRGIGGRPFPEQLEELLNAAGTGHAFRVLNGGVNGSNSSAMAARLPGELDSFRPGLLLVLAGGSNHWNTLGGRAGSGADSLLMHSSVYRFIKLAALKWRSSAAPALQTAAQSCRPERSVQGYDDTAAQRAKPWFLLSPSPLPAALPKPSPQLYAFFLETGGLYRRAGDLASALALSEAAARIEPASAAAQVELAWVYEAGGDFDNAMSAAARAAALDTGLRWLVPLMAARQAVWRGDTKGAASAYEKAVAAGDGGQEVRAGLCRAYAALSAFDKARALCAGHKQNGELLPACMESAALSGDYDGAYALLETAPERSAELWRDFASVLLKKGAYEKAQAYAGKDTARSLALAELFYAAYEQDLAARQLKAVAAQGGGLPGLYYLLRGDLAQSSCDYNAAEEDYRQALRLRPHYWGAYFALGDLKARQKDYGKALSLLKQAAALAPSEPRAYRQLGRVYAAQGLDAPASAEYFKALALQPFSEDLLREAWAAYSGAGKQDDFFSLPEKIPGIRFNPEFHHLARGGAEASALESALQDGIEADLTAVCAMAKDRNIPVLFSSYPEKEMPGAVQAAKACNATYVDLRPRFREFASRRDYISFDNDHPNTAGYNAMARAYVGPVLKALGLKEGEAK